MSELKSFKTSKWQIKLKYDEDFQILMWKAKNGRIPASTVEPINPIIEKINTNKDRWELYCKPKEYEYLIYHLNSTAKKEHEATELTYEKVYEELNGLRGIQLVQAMNKFEWSMIDEDNNAHHWHKLTSLFFGMREAVERGLMKIKRVNDE
jgi:hypothetical protein